MYLCNFLIPCVFCVVQLLSHVRLFVITETTAYQASLSFTISWTLIAEVMEFQLN